MLARVESPELASRLAQERSTLHALRSELGRRRIQLRQEALADEQTKELATLGLGAARRAMRRAELTRAEGLIGDLDYETAEDDLRRAELALAHADQNARLATETRTFELRDQEARVERQRLVVLELSRQVEELSVRAPVAGLVSRLDVADHDAVEQGQALVAVVDLSAFEVEIRVPEGYAAELGPGVAAEVAVSGSRYEARLRSIAPEVESGSVRGVVAFAGPLPDGLRQNQRVSTRLLLDHREDVLKVARGPFLEAWGGRKVYRVRGDIAELIEIRAGATSVGEVEITAGLAEGDEIIVSDTARFQDAKTVYLTQ